MPFDRADLAQLLAESVRTPRSAARRLLALEPGMNLALGAMAASACLSALFSSLLMRVMVLPDEAMFSLLLSEPLFLAGTQALGLILMAAVVTGLGRLFGGRGRLAEALLLLSWADFVLLLAEMAFSLVILALPGPGGVLALVVAGFSVWLAASFIAELHGFASTFAVASALVGGFVLFFAVLAQLAPPMM